MKISYNWLNKYFENKLPPIDEAVDIMTMNSSEVDGVEKKGDDFILDIKILPNMAHYCLCHRGIAKEFSALLDLPIKKYSRDFSSSNFKNNAIFNKIKSSPSDLNIKIENPNDCRRYIGKIIKNIKVGPSPAWLVSSLEAVGQRSINNLVDATNFVMLEIGQPMHIFDADKMAGNLIEIKKAKNNDQITTLDGKNIILDNDILTISNNDKPLAIAGIKGGTLAEIDDKTVNIILESANFDSILIRKTAQKLKIQTDASKRYENEITSELAFEAMDYLTKIIIDIASTDKTIVCDSVDKYPNPVSESIITISAFDVEKLLGLKITVKEIEDIFRRFNFQYSLDQASNFLVKIPADRLDLRLKEDLIEEILKVYGYAKISGGQEFKKDKQTLINKSFYYKNKIREILVGQGFSEIYGYTFSNFGEIELANSVAPEKKFLRTDLSSGMSEHLVFNSRYAELISISQIKIFEIGQVFKINNEYTSLAIGIKSLNNAKNVKNDLVFMKEIVNLLNDKLKTDYFKLEDINLKENILEINFDELIKILPEPISYDVVLPEIPKEMKFKKISIYPFSVRDVAVFTPEEITEDQVLSVIKKGAGELLVNIKLFDIFTKKFPDGSKKISYAFRLVLQSYDHTLSEEEIINVMKIVTSDLNNQPNWQVR